jgi:hypothetical protein
MNGRHAELFTYCLYDTLTSFKANGRLKLLNLLSYQSRIGTDVEPGISIEFLFENNMFRVEIEFNRGQFIIYIPSDKATPYLLNGASLLESLGFAKSDSPYINIYIKESTPDLIESTVLELCEKFAATSSQEQNND